MTSIFSAGRRAALSLIAPVLVTAVVAATPFSASAHGDSSAVTVFAAASLKNAMDAVIAAFTARTKIPARPSYGASSALARQIEQGAPADVFVSADVDWMDDLAKHKLIQAPSRRNLISNHLALIAPSDSKINLPIAPGMPLAAALGSDRLAVAGPDVPAGKYAQASLTALGVWSSVEGRLARAENVRSALAFVSRGETPLGIVYDTDARVEPKVRVVGLFPDSSHPPIVYPIALVEGSRSSGAAAFIHFAEGPEARAIFARFGFVSPAHN
jgi:molybdate transport system substrate-binding protein